MSTYIAGRREDFTAPQWLTSEECCSCHIMFAMPNGFQQRAKSDPTVWFYCPNGHRQHYTGDSVETKLRNAEAKLTAQRDQLESAVRDAENLRYLLLRDRQRFANGVCPCCNRSFENVRNHMTTKHPDYDTTRVEATSAVRYTCSCGSSFATMRGLRIHQGHLRGSDWAAPGQSKWAAHLTKV